MRAGNTGSVVLQDVRVPKANLLGEEGEGFKIAMAALDNGRFTVAAGATGLIQASLEASLRYAVERQTFGKPIADHQLVKRMLSHMVRKLDTSRLLVYKAGWMKNKGRRNTRGVTREVLLEVVREALQRRGDLVGKLDGRRLEERRPTSWPDPTHAAPGIGQMHPIVPTACRDLPEILGPWTYARL